MTDVNTTEDFADDYDGEEDGYEWVQSAWNPLASDVLSAVVAAIARHPGWKVRPHNRGRPTEDEVTLVVEEAIAPASPPPEGAQPR